VLKRFEATKNKPVHQVIQYPYTIEAQKEVIFQEIKSKGRVQFVEIIEKYSRSRIALIFNFLAILEMLAIGRIGIQVGEGYNNFWVTDKTETTEPALTPFLYGALSKVILWFWLHVC
jgi:segregation and condensation protein A